VYRPQDGPLSLKGTRCGLGRHCCLKSNSIPVEQTDIRYSKDRFYDVFSGSKLSTIPCVCARFRIWATVRPKPRPCMRIPYFTSLSFKSEYKGSGVPLFPILNWFRIAPSIDLFTCPNNGFLACRPRRVLIFGRCLESPVLL
jgi:hypothetical protein